MQIFVSTEQINVECESISLQIQKVNDILNMFLFFWINLRG